MLWFATSELLKMSMSETAVWKKAWVSRCSKSFKKEKFPIISEPSSD